MKFDVHSRDQINSTQLVQGVQLAGAPLDTAELEDRNVESIVKKFFYRTAPDGNHYDARGRVDTSPL